MGSVMGFPPTAQLILRLGGCTTDSSDCRADDLCLKKDWDCEEDGTDGVP